MLSLQMQSKRVMGNECSGVDGTFYLSFACHSAQILFLWDSFVHPPVFVLTLPWPWNQLVWNRFINVCGLLGRNIPLDIHMDYMNWLIKDIEDLMSKQSHTLKYEGQPSNRYNYICAGSVCRGKFCPVKLKLLLETNCWTEYQNHCERAHAVWRLLVKLGKKLKYFK